MHIKSKLIELFGRKPGARLPKEKEKVWFGIDNPGQYHPGSLVRKVQTDEEGRECVCIYEVIKVRQYPHCVKAALLVKITRNNQANA